ncbi:MAG: amidohydrolase [Devosia sp.]
MTAQLSGPTGGIDDRALRHELHRHPQTGFDVDATASLVSARLRAGGLDVQTDVGGGLVATLRRGTGNRAIALRAELDGLPIQEVSAHAYQSQTPGKFHGCGHDGHMTMLIVAALRLAEQDSFEGTVHFIFQPDEENGRGAQAMIKAGLFDRFAIDAIYGMHNMPGMPVGSFATSPGIFTAFEDTFEIGLSGRGGHSSAPDLTIDPLVPGAALVLALQTIVARSVSPREHCVVSITELVTDGARNVIPSTATLRGDARGYRDTVSQTIEQRMGEIVAGVAAAHGVQSSLRYQRDFRPLINTAAETDLAVAAAGTIAGATVQGRCERVGFSEDFAHFLTERPGCFVLMGNGTDGAHGASLHNPGYDFNDAALPFGIAYWLALVQAELGQ